MSNLQIFDITGIFLLALIIGGMFFFAAIMTPLVFTKLPPEISGPFIRKRSQLQPGYGGMTLAAALSLWSYSESVYLISVVILFLWAWLWLMPRINRYRDEQLKGNEKAEKTFNILHRLSVGVNLAQMWVIGFVLYKVLTQA
ncbi:MAG: hypothetical protein Ct9H300mP23_00830 [Nitrospinota bacterium]|nr:MAG: hypothetical protein Ct9H300mP23_00830 [Nitrospinota bacterium]